MRRIRVMLVDDHQLVREGLRSLLEREEDIEIAGEADNGNAACVMARELSPDVIVMDVELKGMNGLQATRHIKERMPSVRILALTMHRSEETIYAMLKGGAEGYLLKYAAARELTSAVRAVYRGESVLSPAIANKLIKGVREKSSYLHSDEILSKREKAILLLMARGDTSREIGSHLCISPKTVDNHRANIIQKLNARNRVEAIMNAVNLGVISQNQGQGKDIALQFD